MVSKISSYLNILDRLAKYQQQPNEVFRKQGRGLKRRSTRGEGGPENLKYKYRGVRQRRGKWVSQIGNENLDYYVNDFENAFLIDMVDYYTRKGFSGIMAVDCMQEEKDMVSYYLHFSTEEKLLKQVQGQVLPENAQQDLGKEMQCKA
ncbi:hypothetical protein MKX03_019748 [Papaver bracteatum]|nr:hypothetical protein MKX03_019748 [Papaver bracteatum]